MVLRALFVALLLDPTTASEDTENCPWLSRNTGAEHVLGCADGTMCNGMHEGWECCSGRGGREVCPPNLPNMCAGAQRCGGGDYCCEETCEAGIRPCEPGGGGTPTIVIIIGVVAMLLIVVLVGVYVRNESKTTPPTPPTSGTAPPTLPPTAQAVAMPIQTMEREDPQETLAKLKSMLDQGLITQADFDTKKAEVLDQI